MQQARSSRNLAVSAWSRLVRIYQSLDRESEANFSDLGLNTACFDVLARVSARQGLSQGELAAALLVTKGNISQLVDKLARDGLLERQADGRTRRLFLTPQGRELAGKALPRQELLLKSSMAGLTETEQRQLVALLRKWRRT